MAEDEFDPPGWPFNQPQPPGQDAPRSYEPPPHPGYASDPPPPNPSQQFPPPGPAGYEPPAWRPANSGQPPPPTPGAFAPEPKRRRRGLWGIVGFIFVALALLIGACTVWFVGAVTAPVDAANEFLAAIDDGDYSGAVTMTAPRCNNGLTAADLESRFRNANISYNLNQSSVQNAGATVRGTITIGSESPVPIRLELLNSNRWQVCGFRLG